MKNYSALLMVVLLAAASQPAAAQELGAPGEATGDLPPALSAGDDESTLDLRREDDGAIGDLVEPAPEPIAVGESIDGFDGSILEGPAHMLQACPPYFESSGTWLRRGFWYTEVDYCLLNRSWDKHGVVLASEETTSVTNPTTLTQPYIVSNVLNVQGHSPGAEGLGRVKLGRFLFRDVSNRDHLLEASYFGGGEFTQDVSLESSTADNGGANAGLQVSNFIDRVNTSFDDAAAMAFRYTSEMNSGELNYLVRQRMQKDRMLLQPSGEWVRAATPTYTKSFLAGLRYVNLSEMLDWTAENNPNTAAADEGGSYFVETTNHLLGLQTGASLGLESARWSITASVKGGGFWNRVHLDSEFDLNSTPADDPDGATDSTEDDLAFVGEFQLLGKWHLRPNVSLRAGGEILFIDSIALAPHQVNFIPGGYSAIARSGDSIFMGGSFGVESYW